MRRGNSPYEPTFLMTEDFTAHTEVRPPMAGNLRMAFAAAAVIAGLGVVILLATGLFDYFYIRYFVAQFDQGLAEIDLANPRLMKALVSGLAAAMSWYCLRSSAISIGFVRNIVSVLTTGAFAWTALVNLIAGVATWGHYFDGIGHSRLRYEITYDNKVVFYSSCTISPRTGQPLAEVTPDVVYELEARRNAGSFREILSPPTDGGFTPGTAQPRYWYSLREDGSIHLFNMPGHDPVSRAHLAPITREILDQFSRQKKRQTEVDQAMRIRRQQTEKMQASLSDGSAMPGERFPQTRLRLLSAGDTADWSAAEIRYAINEMFARRGAAFQKKEIQKAFDNLPWYRPRRGLSFDDVEKEFTAIEEQNLLLLAGLRDGRVLPLAQARPSPRSQRPRQPAPKPEGRPSWQVNLLPNINISLNGRPLSRPSQGTPFHPRCRAHHYPNNICPATGQRNTP